jgi:hypothetical protein
MSRIDWKIEAYDLSACNCAWGCPCQFSAIPTTGFCRATVAFHVNRGHFGTTRLDDLNFGGLFAWPGPIHEGGGEVQPIIDERADAKQREALLQIMSGAETEPGATIFNVFAATYAKVHDPLYCKVDFGFDLDKRTAHFVISHLVDARVEPIRNPVTREPQRVRVVMPSGFEFHEAEFASSTVRTEHPTLKLDWTGRHAHLTEIAMSGSGVRHH